MPMSDDWQIKFTLQAEKDLKRLDGQICQRVAEKLHWLAANFLLAMVVPLDKRLHKKWLNGIMAKSEIVNWSTIKNHVKVIL